MDIGSAQEAPLVGVVVGSTRPGRICLDIAQWVVAAARDTGSPLRYEVVDLAEVALPFLDEPGIPAEGSYTHEHTRAWSRLVSSFDAFVFVFPQYNWGYPAVLKNALDFLYAEWAAKPAGIVSYGTRGGGRAAEQLQSVLQGLHMLPVDSPVLLSIADGDTDDDGALIDLEATLAAGRSSVRQLAAQLVTLTAD